MAATAKARGGRNRRRIRNFLLDRRFQLKYAGYLVLVAAVLSVSLGLLLWSTSQSLVGQSREAVRQSEQVVELSRDVAAESKKVSEVVKMNIIKDPVYSESPELLAAFKADANKQEATIKKQQEALEAQAAALTQQSANIAAEQRTMFLTLLLVLTALVVGVGLAGIVVTHKVAGPIFKMTRQIRTVASGNWRIPQKLRKGDELMDFFGEFETMVRSLREQREKELSLLDAATEKIEKSAGEDDVEPLAELRTEMNKVLEG
jgi:hypothetical protein